MALSIAMEEAYAANPHGESVIETVEFGHGSFDAPARFATGTETDISVPLVLGGPAVLFKRIPISVTLPGVSEDGPSPMKLRLHDVNGEITPYLEMAAQSTGPIKITYRAYTTKDLTQPGDVISGLELRDVDQDADGSEGTVGFREIELQAFPLRTYDEDLYPTLQNN